MKLGKLIKYIDGCTDLLIFQNVGVGNNESWQIVFEGIASEVPWTLMNCHLIKTEDNEGDGAIDCFPEVDNNGKKIDNCYIRITLGD
jgi:hypothetical protein